MRLPKGRTLAYAVAVLLCGVGAFFLITAQRYRQDFCRWQTANPVDIAIDMSHPGEVVGAFKQTCHISHGEALCLMLPSNMVATTTWTNLLQDLRFVARIEDQNGKEKVREEFTGDLFWRDYLLDGTIPLLQFAPFEKGDYRLTLTVTEGVSALHGTPQRLVARYMLCGLEMMPAFISMVMGLACFAVAGVVALVTALVVKRRRKRGTEQHTTTA
jgi:hypothetical protein